MVQLPRPRRILVIGGGPTGLVALRNLLDRGQFDHVELVERRDDIGGVWYLDHPDLGKTDNRPRWPSPSYPGMVGNVLPTFLSYSQYPFPPRSSSTQPFPTLIETHEYLQGFARPFLETGNIRLNTEVVGVDELGDGEGRGWKVTMKDWSDDGKGRVKEEVWDAVVISVGWYDHPVWPETEGLEEVREKRLAIHAKWWRGPMGYGGKRVLVVGNANSSNDIAAQLAPVARTPVYRSVRRIAFPGFPSLPDTRIHDVAPVAKYVVKSTSNGVKVNITLKDDTEINDVDAVLIGSGYRPYPNFIRVLDTSPDGKGGLVPLVAPTVQPHRIPSLHRHILYAHNPSLAFVGAPMAYTPFTVADVSSTWLTLAWSGELQYPDTPEGRLVFEKERLEAVEKFRAQFEIPSSLMVYSVLGNDEKAYAQGLRDEIVAVRGELGAVLPEWTDENWKAREAMYAIKLESLKVAKGLEDGGSSVGI